MCDHFRKLENMYMSSPWAAQHQPVLEVSEGAARLTFDAHEEFFHAAGAVHGSICFKALDDAAYFAVNSLVRDCFVLTSSFTIYLLRPVSGGTLCAEGRVVSRGRTLFVAESVLTAGGDRQVARGSGTFMRSQVRLDERVGYC
jgi:uncharacterized protein (TIGR00369 family)